MTVLEEIKKALEDVTPGPWFDWETNEWLVDPQRLLCRYVDASFIARCDPLAISELVSTLESLQRENEAMRQRLDAGPHGEDAIDVAESAADHLRHRAEAAEFEVKRYRVALIAAKTRMRNCRGAIESDQVVDKDVHGSLQNGIRDIEAALASTGGEHHGN